MDRTNLLSFLEGLYEDYDASIPTSAGTSVRTKIFEPLIQRFGDDPYSTDVDAFVRDLLQSEFPNTDFSELSSYSDVVVTPFKVIIEPLRRELLRLRMSQSLSYKDFLSEEEIEGLVSVFQVLRKAGTRSILSIRAYVRAPRSLEFSFGASAYTAGGLTYSPLSYTTYTPDEVAQNREGDYFYVDVTFQAVAEGSEYSIGPKQITGINGVSGVVWATNPSASDPAEDRETIDEYLGRLASWVSEHAPITDDGTAARVTSLFPQITDVYVVGNGDDYMHRDILSYEATTEATLPSGYGSGTLVAWAPNPGFPALQYAVQMNADFTSVLPPTVPTSWTPSSIVVNGIESPISTIGVGSCLFSTFDPASPYGTNGSTSVFIVAPNGMAIPHYLGFVDPTKDLTFLEEDDKLFLYDGVSAYTEYDILDVTTTSGQLMLVLKGPVSLVQYSTHPVGFTFDSAVVNYGEFIEFYSSLDGEFKDFLGSAPVEVGDHLVVENSVGTRYEYSVSYVSSTRLRLTYFGTTTKPISPTILKTGVIDSVVSSTRKITDADGGFLVPPGVYNNYEFLDLDASPAQHGTITGVTATELEISAETWSDQFSPTHNYRVYTFPSSLIAAKWVIYRRTDGAYDDELVSENNITWAAMHNVLNLVPYTSGTAYWQTRRPTTSSDLLLTASLPDGVSETSEVGYLHLGGCSDVYMKTQQVSGIGGFAGVYDLLPLMTALATWVTGSDTINLNSVVLYTNTGAPVPSSFVAGITSPNLGYMLTLGVDDSSPRRGYRILNIGSSESALIAQLSEELSDTQNNVPVTIYFDHKTTVATSQRLKQSRSDAQIGFSQYVVLDTPALSIVSPEDTFEILSSKGKGTYTIEAVLTGGLVLKLYSVVSDFDSGVSYKIYSGEDGINVPFARVDHVELKSETGATGVNMYYRLPVACRVMGDSVTDGPDKIIPPEGDSDFTQYLGSVAHLVPAPAQGLGNTLGLLAWSGDVEEMGVKEGDIVILHGTLNNYSGRILVAEYSAVDEQSYVLYTSYGHATADEDNVRFEVHASQVVSLRMYFQNPIKATVGYWYPCLYTEFSYDDYDYHPHPDNKETMDLPVAYTELEVDASAGATSIITTDSDDIRFGTLEVKAGDIVVLRYAAIIGTPIAESLAVAGKSITLTLDGSAKTFYFSGSGNLSLVGTGGVTEQLKAAFGISSEARAYGVGTLQRLYLVSTSKLVVTSGTALSDLGLVASMTNDVLPESLKGSHQIIEVSNDKTLIVDTSFTQSAKGDGSMIGLLIRTGVQTITPAEMLLNTEFGFYYMDVELVSTQDAIGSHLEDNTCLTLGDNYYGLGFEVETDSEYSYGPSEAPYLWLSNMAVTASGALVPSVGYGYDVHYYEAPVISSVQTVLRSKGVRATDNNMMAKEKPRLLIGVGPLTYAGDSTDVVSAAQERIKNRVKERMAALRDVTLSDILSVLTPLGIEYGDDATLYWFYEDLERKRQLRFGDYVRFDRLWAVDVPSSMLTFTA